MSYESVAKNPGTYNDPGSMYNRDTASATDKDVFYILQSNSRLYMDQSNRDRAIWVLQVDGKTTGALGKTAYKNVALLKGLGPVYDANGKVTEIPSGDVYWYAVKGQDGNNPITQYRYMNIRLRLQTNKTMQNTSVSEDKERYYIEDLGDGCFLIYYYEKNSDNQEDIRVLTCDAEGNWSIEMYTDKDGDNYPPVSQAKGADLEKLKVRLYQYTPYTTYKTIEFTGDTTYNVKLGATQEQLLSCIQENISLVDTGRQDLPIPCSGTPPGHLRPGTSIFPGRPPENESR